jgi:hypothetical protein
LRAELPKQLRELPFKAMPDQWRKKLLQLIPPGLPLVLQGQMPQ